MQTYEIPAKVNEALAHLDKAKSLMSQGPLDYYLRKLCEHSEALLTKFAPMCVGDEAIIIGEIKCDGGWKGSEKHLQIGTAGEVVDVDYSNGKFVVDFVPHQQWYKSSGDNTWVLKSRNHSYHISASKLQRIEPTSEGE